MTVVDAAVDTIIEWACALLHLALLLLLLLQGWFARDNACYIFLVVVGPRPAVGSHQTVVQPVRQS